MNQLKSLLVLASASLMAGAFASPFELLVTETPNGTNPNPTSWKGIQRYGFTGTGSSATMMSSFLPSQVNDPAGLYFNGGELFVGNRHGNTFAASVSRFTYDGNTDVFTANGTITGNGLFGVHGLAIRPGTNDLYASNVNAGVSIFATTGGGATPNGMILSGATRDVMFSADGNNMYVSQGVNGTLTRHNFLTNSDTNYSIAGASGLHFGNWRNDHLFVGDFSSGKVYDIQFDALGAVTSSSAVANVGGAIGVAFSPDNMEMFVSSHTGNTISRFLYNTGTSSWDFQSSIAAGSNLGDIQVISTVPEPATLAVLGIGVVALLRRRRSLAK